MNKLLSRDEFRERVFIRDGHKCMFCGEPAVDAHHILDRKLWPDGGYYINNGVSVCESCHIDCERSVLTVENCREASGITDIIVPPQLHDDQQYDKWGKPTTKYIKYPHTWYMPWCSSVSREDRGRVQKDLSHFEGQDIIVTEKMDGENTTMYNDHIHARSLDSRNHPSRNWVKQFWSERRHNIPEGWRICGENMYAQHSIRYENLYSYFLGFSVWNDRNQCLSWDETCEWFEMLDITPVRTLYSGPYVDHLIRELHKSLDFERQEGYVLRLAGEISYKDFPRNMLKYVRDNHVQTTDFWMHNEVVPNKLVV